jgi:hypothetical protein
MLNPKPAFGHADTVQAQNLPRSSSTMPHGGGSAPYNGELLEMDFDLGRILAQLLVDLVARVLARWIPISTMNPPLRVIAGQVSAPAARQPLEAGHQASDGRRDAVDEAVPAPRGRNGGGNGGNALCCSDVPTVPSFTKEVRVEGREEGDR